MTGVSSAWNPARRRLDLWTAPALSVRIPSTTIDALLTRGPEGIGETVSVEGEYLGRPVGGIGLATAAYAPGASSWLLRGTGGCIWCTNAAPMTLPFPMTAYGSRGCRLRVTGTIVADGAQGIRLLATGAAPVTGLPGITCLVESAHPTGHGTLRLHVLLAGAGLEITQGHFPTPVARVMTYIEHNMSNLSIKETSVAASTDPGQPAHAVIECDVRGLRSGVHAVSVEMLPGVRTFEVLVRLGE